MEIGRCPRCTTPYTSSEVTGFGVLRGRSAQKGGPRVEYACQGCGNLIRLIAHGAGRYAPPGQPPPAVVPESERRPPWMRGERRGPGSTPPPRAEPQEEPPVEIPVEEPAPEPPPADAPPPAEPDAEEPIGPVEAVALLGIEPSADRSAIEKAFRERSLTCHPDKVAHLDLEFQQLAERKFRRLQRAYDLLTGQGGLD